MYIVTIQNDDIYTEIHNESEKLLKGSVVKGINCIDTFSFSLLPSNVGWYLIKDFTTLVTVYNTNKERYEFMGRVLYSSNSMSENGLLTKDVTCESYFGFMCDSQQNYVEEKNWTVEELFNHIIDVHNSQLEQYKCFKVGTITATAPNNNIYCGIQRDNTWNTIKTKLLDDIGGEITFRMSRGVIYIDYLEQIGNTKATTIELSKNMKAIIQEKDPSAYVTRLIPLGCKLTKEVEVEDDEGNVTTETVETEERLDISVVNDGKNYIDDEEAIERFGLHIAYQEWDDVTSAYNLKIKGEKWLEENNKVLVKYSITALDLSLIGLDIDDFEVHNKYPIKNALLGIDDTARIIKKTIDVCEEIKTTIEIGDNYKTLSELQLEQANRILNLSNKVTVIEKNYATNVYVISEVEKTKSLINQTSDSILLQVKNEYVSNSTLGTYKKDVTSEIEQSASDVTTTFTKEITDVNNNLEKYEKYIRLDDDGITIGENTNSIKLKIDNDGIVFLNNGIAFGKWDGNNFHTGNIVVKLNERAQFGNFAFIPRSDNSLSFLKVGG